jgi:hypothetical protein
MTGIINNIIAGQLPSTARELKEQMDHCEAMIEDCNETIQNHEVQQHERNDHIMFRSQAMSALYTLKKIKL